MRLLMLGGTTFVGWAAVEDALARGWDVTTFSRGESGEPPAGVKHVVGDRRSTDDVARLAAAGEWDIVVDAWSQEPAVVHASARALRDRVGFYAYVSSESVYVEPPARPDELAPVVEADPDVDGDYAQRKRGGELAVFDVYGETRALAARAGLILGPREFVGRLPWWLRMVADGGDVAAPGRPERRVQFIDARDLAAFVLDAAAAGAGGAFNVVAPLGQFTFGQLLEACIAVTGSSARLRWVPDGVVLEAGLQPWMGVPLWAPETPEWDWIYGSDVSKALAAGLRCRSLEDTVRDAWAWLQSAPPAELARLRIGSFTDPAQLRALAARGAELPAND